MKSKLKLLLRPVIFVIVLLVMLSTFNTLFMPVWDGYNNYFTLNGFYKEPKNTVENLFLGASIPASSISSTDLYKEYGICAYSLANVQQPVISSYYLLQEAYKNHSKTLKNVVFDVSELRDKDNDQIFHKSIDYMRLSPLKIKAIYEYCKGDVSKMFNFIFPFSEFHNRWTDLGWKDFEYFGKDPVNGTRGYDFLLNTYRYSEDSLDDIKVKNVHLYEDAKPSKLVTKSLKYFDEIAKFCEEKGIKLTLIKLYANNWNSSLHNAVANVADEYGLEFIDFNFEPYASQLDFFHAFDTRDGRHANYYGASKVTSWLGKYLVEECGATDVRGDERYAYMDEQADMFDKLYYRAYELSQAENVVESISIALKDNNSLFLTVKEDAGTALTEEQRAYFREIGLVKLAELTPGAAYIGVIENGKVSYEDVLAEVDDDTDSYISYFVRLDDGTRINLLSGYEDDEYVSSCKIDSREKSRNRRGLNFVVYSNEYERFISAESFDTSVSTPRQYYNDDFYTLFTDKDAIKKYSSNRYFKQGQIYNAMYEAKNSGIATEKITAHNDVFSHIDKYIGNTNNVIIISVKDDASRKLSDEDRAAFAELGLEQLSELGKREAYIAVIDGGNVVYEEKGDENKATVSYKSDVFEVTSSGFSAENISSILINEKEYSDNGRGLNIVVYNKQYKQVFDSRHFDTYSKVIKRIAVELPEENELLVG